MNKKEILSELKLVSGKSLSECLKAYNETKNIEKAFELLLKDEIEEIKKRVNEEDEQLILQALIASKSNIDGALSILTHGYDCFSKEKTMYPEFLKQDSITKKYDDASWHYEGDYPEDLSQKNGATHIGMFLTWCIDNDLISEELLEDTDKETQQVRNRKMTGADFLIKCCDEKLLDEDLNERGNEFAKDYYDNDTAFGGKYSSYIDDYAQTFDKQTEDDGFEYESIYHIKDTFENYNILKPIIDRRYNEWKKYRGKNNESTQTTIHEK